MKSGFTVLIFFAIPVILCSFLFMVVMPLLIQRFFKQKSSGDVVEYPYLTSWEEAA